MAALRTIQASAKSLGKLQSETATGLRVAEASHNAAYWTISVGMKSTVKTMSAVQDALGLSAAVADVTYSALEQTAEVLSQIRDRVIMASTDGVDHRAIQQEIAKLASQTLSIAESSTFGGVNWLITDIEDIYEGDPAARSKQILSSYTGSRDAPLVQHILFDLQSSSLFNSTGGGILEPDPRSPKSLGGIRHASLSSETGYGSSNSRQGSAARQDFMFTGPIDFSSGGSITFDVTVDKDNPSHDIDPPYGSGRTTTVTIDLSVVNAALGTGAGGVISDYGQYISVLSTALTGSGASATYVSAYPSGYVQDRIALLSNASTGYDGSQLSISNLVSDVGTGGLAEFGDVWGTRGNAMTLTFEPFKVHQDVVVTFEFRINGATSPFTIDRATVDSILGRDDGTVETAADMATLLESIIGQPGLEIGTSGNSVTINTDRDDRWAGNKSRLGFTSISVNIEPIPSIGIMDIDVEANPHMVPAYLSTVSAMLSRVIDGAAAVGALRNRIDSQMAYNALRSDAIGRGIGQLVDADMEKTAARLRAEEIRQQLAVHALSISNQSPNNILQLFG